VLPEACRGEQVDFAARGADFRAAQIGAGFNAVRGTSFATPIVAGLLASAHGTLDPASAVRAIDDLAAGAADLGRQGIDTTYGRGLVGAPLRLGWE
jgi:subtilase family serine protease